MMQEGKMDWNAFVSKANEEYGTTDEDWEPLRQAAVIKFDYDEKNNLSGTYQRKMVYPDWGHITTIGAGEIWLVSLSMNPKTYNNYFAKPLQRIDGSFLYEMKKDQIDSFAKDLWENNRVVLEPIFEEKYSDVINQKIAEAVATKTEELEKIIDKLNEDLATQNRINEEDKSIIQSNEERIDYLTLKVKELESQRTAQPAAEKPQKSEAPSTFPDTITVPKVVVLRSGPDMITSEQFTKSRYFVHLSADHRMMLIRDDKNGSVVCIDNTIMLDGLSTILPYNEGDMLMCEYSKTYGGFVVYLK